MQPRCLYCGAALPAAAVEEAALARVEALGALPPPAADRCYLALDLAGVAAETLARALGLSAYEADQRCRRGGWQLVRVLDVAEAVEEVRRLEAAGLRPLPLPEAEVRRAESPFRADSGGWRGDRLALHAGEEESTLLPGEALLVVRGPIAREYLTQARDPRLLRLASLEPGHLVHVHPRAPGPPVEFDALDFDFGETPLSGSTLLELLAWSERLAGEAPVDDGFRLLPPVLAPAPGTDGVAAALGRRHEAAPVLDNVAQFREYSGWRAALERRRGGGA